MAMNISKTFLRQTKRNYMVRSNALVSAIQKNQPTPSHCIHCSIRFINGKIYARDGKNLKPVKVKYPSGKNPFTQCENFPIPNSTISQVSPTVHSVNVGRNQ